MVDAPAASTPVFVTEAVVALYGARPGTTMTLPLPNGQRIEAFVRGVWRDYARQHGAIAIDAETFVRLTGDTRVNDLALWLAPGADLAAVQSALRAVAGETIEFATMRELRAASLTIFDRSFAVTRWLQIVAIGIGLAGIAASFSAQVLARRREFGLLAHLGVTRREVLAIVAAEGLVWSTVGVALGLLLGIAVERGAGVRRQSAELSLDHGAAAARRAPCGARCCGAGGGHVDRGTGGACQCGPRRRARGEGGLVVQPSRERGAPRSGDRSERALHSPDGSAPARCGGSEGLRRRALLLSAAALPSLAYAQTIQPRVLVFPRDHGAHPATRVEWWYITGALETEDSNALYGWQITFFRVRTDVARDHPSAFAAKQIVLAHAALTDVAQRRLRHDELIAREGFGIARADQDDTRLALRDWSLVRGDDGVYRARASSSSAAFGFDLALVPSQPPLLQGDAGWSRKGPRAEQASHYVSQPQLEASGMLAVDGRSLAVRGRAWLDHEWSDAYLDREAVGWDWIGMNLDDGAALMAFRMRRRDGSALWAGGSFRSRDGALRDFAADEVRFVPGRTWSSAATRAAYPVEWRIETPAGVHRVRALVDAQELDSRASTGTAYWEGLSDLLDAQGRRVGRGYLEMTGYAGRLRL